ncbi:MAG: outer membrane lipoprotein-sorting protein [candidate division KSB1 bacterium]|nr:outer membrane lipoprotein-sorting protein [candidate division KSB1 bacterium]MDZ7304886.1 outer membrane lipoprotein-sorting protein [candidate division KSB1 bacterium]MDZ7314370.1 outer membrane lipoprotein-sorting protein [candidate division KSB1 bacterium]
MLRKVLGLVFFISILFNLTASAQTVDELISKNLEARGGMEKLKAATSMKMSGKMLFQGMEAPFTIYAARPNSVRIDMTLQGKTMVQAYDGQTAWMIMPFMGSTDPEKMPEEASKEIQEQADFDGPLVDYKEKGHTVELIGKEDLEGTEVYKLKVTLKNGDVRYVYLDGETFVELKWTGIRKRQGAEFEVDTYLSDYKPVDGLVFPHAIESKVKGQTMNQMTVEKIELNVPVDEAMFKMPAKTTEKQPAKQ